MCIHQTPAFSGRGLNWRWWAGTVYTHEFWTEQSDLWYNSRMSERTDQLWLPDPESDATKVVRQLKMRLVVSQKEPRGDRVTANYKIRRDLHAQMLAVAARHGVSLTDLVNDYFKRLLPVLQNAALVEVEGYKPEQRTLVALEMKKRKTS